MWWISRSVSEFTQLLGNNHSEFFSFIIGNGKRLIPKLPDNLFSNILFCFNDINCKIKLTSLTLQLCNRHDMYSLKMQLISLSQRIMLQWPINKCLYRSYYVWPYQYLWAQKINFKHIIPITYPKNCESLMPNANSQYTDKWINSYLEVFVGHKSFLSISLQSKAYFMAWPR